MLYFAVGDLGLDGGIMVTASHNPKEYTGMKIVRAGALPVGRRVGSARRPRPRARRRVGGAAARRDPQRGHLVGLRRPGAVVRRRRRRSGRSGSWSTRRTGWPGTMLPPVLERLPMLDVVRCYFEPDGSFPNHEPNPLLPENRAVHRRADARRRRRLRRRVRRRRRPLLLRRRQRRVRARRLHDGALRRVDPRARAGRQGDLRRARVVGGAGGDPGGRRRAARQPRRATRSSSSGCARRAPSSAARSRRTTTSATSRRPTRGRCRSC